MKAEWSGQYLYMYETSKDVKIILISSITQLDIQYQERNVDLYVGARILSFSFDTVPAFQSFVQVLQEALQIPSIKLQIHS